MSVVAKVYLALGSNLGDRRKNLSDALVQLGARVTIHQTSPIYETEPWGIPNQPRFLNMAAMGETELGPQELLEFIKQIERQMGRTEGVRYGPRVIDVDILFYDNLVSHSEELEIPHPRLAERRFVLVPLADIAPDLIHPSLRLSIRELLARLPNADDVRPLTTGGLSNN